MIINLVIGVIFVGDHQDCWCQPELWTISINNHLVIGVIYYKLMKSWLVTNKTTFCLHPLLQWYGWLLPVRHLWHSGLLSSHSWSHRGTYPSGMYPHAFPGRLEKDGAKEGNTCQCHVSLACWRDRGAISWIQCMYGFHAPPPPPKKKPPKQTKKQIQIKHNILTIWDIGNFRDRWFRAADLC